MPYKNRNEDKSLRELLDSLGQYKKYESFSSTPNHPQGGVYNDIMDAAAKTASGLIYDAVATTARLDSADRRKHKYAQDVFAAFCLHHCIVALSNPLKYRYVDSDIALMVAERTYTSVINFLKKRLDEGKTITSVRRCLISWARKKSLAFIPKTPVDGETVPLEVENEDAQIQMRTEVVEYIMQKASENMDKEDLIADLDDLLDECRSLKILTREDIDIICYSFGFGDGYEPLNTLGIAKKIGHDSRYVKKHLEEALKRLRQFIMQEDNYERLRRLI